MGNPSKGKITSIKIRIFHLQRLLGKGVKWPKIRKESIKALLFLIKIFIIQELITVQEFML